MSSERLGPCESCRTRSATTRVRTLDATLRRSYSVSVCEDCRRRDVPYFIHELDDSSRLCEKCGARPASLFVFKSRSYRHLDRNEGVFVCRACADTHYAPQCVLERQDVLNPETGEVLFRMLLRAPAEVHTTECLGGCGRMVSTHPEKLPLCGHDRCAMVALAEQTAKEEARIRAKRARVVAECRAEAEAERGRLHAADLDGFLQLANDTAPRALADGTRATNPEVPLTDMTALVPLPGRTTALATLVTPSEAIVEERRGRRRAWETAGANLHSAWEALLSAEHAFESDSPARALRAQFSARDNQLRVAVSKAESQPDAVTPEQQQELRRLEDALDSTAAQLAPLTQRVKELKQELETAKQAHSAAFEDYLRWLAIELERRLPRLLNEEPALTRACSTCGHPILFGSGEFCGDECRTRYRRFEGEWLPQCATCYRYFIIEGTRTADAVGPLPGREKWDDDRRFCSPRCLLVAPEIDPDDWPAPDAPPWAMVVHVPPPPRTTAQRAAETRKKILALAKRFAARRNATAASAAQRWQERLVFSPTEALVRPTSPRALPPPPEADMPRTAKERLLAVMESSHGPMSLAELVAATAKSKTAVFETLKLLVAQGRVGREGEGSKTDPHRYFFVHSVRNERILPPHVSDVAHVNDLAPLPRPGKAHPRAKRGQARRRSRAPRGRR